MSAIISGKVRMDVQRIDLAPVVEAAVETVRPAADAKGIRLQIAARSAARARSRAIPTGSSKSSGTC